MKRRQKQTFFNNFYNLKKEANMFLSINQNIGNLVNNALLYFTNKSATEQSSKEIEATTEELNQSLIDNNEQGILVAEEQKTNNSDIQRDLKEEFLRSILCSSFYKTPESEFIEKFLDNPKFSNVLTKKIDHQELSEIETILLNSIMKHIELLSRFESFGDYFFRFLADPLNGRYFPEREDFETEQEYEKSMQKYEKEQAETSEKFEARFQEYETLIADSLAKIEKQLEFSVNMKIAS